MLSTRRFNLIWNLIKILVALVLVGYVILKTDLQELLALRAQIIPEFLIATFLLYGCLTMLKALTYHILLQQDTSYWRVLNIVVMQNALSNYLANSVGIASYLTMLKVEEKVKMGRSGLVFLITKIGDLFAVWLVMVICSGMFWRRIVVLREAVIILEGIIAIGLVFFFASLFFRKQFISLFNYLLNRLHLTRFDFVDQVTRGLDAFAEMEQGIIFQIVIRAFGLSLIYYLFTLAWMVASMRTFNFEAETWVIIFVTGVLQLFSFLPVNTFGGLGVTEVTSLYFYSSFGVKQDGLTAILVGWRVLYYLTNLFVLAYLPLYTIFIERKIKPRTP